MSKANLTALERTEIEMEYAVPLIRRLQDVLGEEVINAALAEANERAARKAHDAFPRSGREASCARVGEAFASFAAGGALDYEVVAAEKDHAEVNVTRCMYTEMMERLGGRDLGGLLMCDLDYANSEAVGYSMTRTQTIMKGASHCDFCFHIREDAADKAAQS